MMPFPPDVARMIIAGFVILGFFGVAYLRGNSFKSKIMYLLLLFVVLLSVASIWLAIASVTMMSDQHVYAQRQPVHILMSVFSRPYLGGTFTFQSGPYPMQKRSGFTFYKLNGANWEELNTDCPECVFVSCVNDMPVERYQTSWEGQCILVTDKPYTWDQTVYTTDTIICGGKSYVTHSKTQVGSGRYRAEFCYGKAFNFDWDSPSCVSFHNTEPTCVETEFFIR